MKTKFTRISSILLAMMLLVAMVPMQALALDNGGAGGSEAGELQWICVSGTHSWDAGEVTTAATCTGTGVRTFTCTLCGQTKTENISATGHAYGDWTVTTEATCGNPGERTRVCANDPTHVEVEVIAATGVHVPGALIPGTPATCTEAGTLDHYVCQQCGANIDGEGNLLGNITVPATGHTVVQDAAVAPTCTEDGLTAGSHCSVCNAVIVAQEVDPATGHEYGEWTVTTAATCTTAGQKTRVCAHDSTHVEIETIPATGHTWVAWQEGDDIADFTLKTEATTESAAVYYKNCSVDGVSAQGIDETATFTYGDPLPDEPDIMYGDVDGDGAITTFDPVLLNQYFAGLVTADALSAGADVDGDGVITTFDPVLINHYFAGLVTVDDFGPQE